jgi:superfamily II DNA or RNA helicase
MKEKVKSTELSKPSTESLKPDVIKIKAPIEKRLPLDQVPVQVLSVMYTLELTQNFCEIIADCWPKVALYLPFEKRGCKTCDFIHDKLAFWYRDKQQDDGNRLLSKIDLEELASMDERLLTSEIDANLEQHQHGFVLNEEYLVMLPKKPKEIAPAVIAARQQKALERKSAKKALLPVAPQPPIPTTVVPQPVIDTNTEKAIAAAVAAATASEAKLDSWTLRTWKSLKDTFFVKHVNGLVSSWGGFEKFTPWPYQERLMDYIKTHYDWKEAIEKHEHFLAFLLYWKQGLGKTPGILYAFQQNPPPEVDVVCDISLIEQRWVPELYRFFPALHGTTVYRFHGYDEFRSRIKESGPERERNRVVIVDESQEYRRLTPEKMYDLEAFRESMATFGLSGTPFINTVDDLFGLNVFMEVSPLETMAEIAVKQELYAKEPIQQPGKNKRKREENDIAGRENPYHYMTSSNAKGFYRFLYENYQNRVFFYEPVDAIKTVMHDVCIPMTWRQTFYYVMNSRQTITFGNVQISSGLRNSFDTMLRRVSNCLMDPKNDDILWDSPKYDWLLDFTVTNYMDLEKRKQTFPMIVFSKFKKRGVVGYNKKLNKLGLEMRRVIMTGDTSGKDRGIYCNNFNHGDLDAMLISKIGRRGLDLTGCRTMVMFEVADSKGEEEQTIARCVRWGKKEAQSAPPINIYRPISTFPTHTPNVAEQKVLWQCIADQAKTPLNAFKTEVPNAIALLEKMVDAMKHTVDQKCILRNPGKAREFERPDLLIKACSIPFEDIPEKYNELLHKLI